MIEDPMPIDCSAEELADLVSSDTRREIITGLDELMMKNPTEAYEPRVARLVIDVAALDDDARNHFVTVEEIQEAAERLREEHLPVLDEYGVLEHDRDEDCIRTTKSTMLFAAAVEEIGAKGTTNDVKRAAEAWLSTTRGPA